MGTNVWLAYLGAVALVMLAYFFVGQGLQSVVYDAVGLSAVVAGVIGVRRYRPPARAAWYLMAAGTLLFVAGDVTFTFYERVLGLEAFPSIADVFYLGGYPLLAAGLVWLVRARAAHHDTLSLLDAATLVTSVAVASWIFLVTPYAGDVQAPLLDRAVSAAYPLADLLLLALTVRLAVGAGVRPASFYLLIASFGTLLVADTAYTALALAGQYHSGHPSDAGWLLAYGLLGAAALHPRMAVLSSHVHVERSRPSPMRFLLLGLASLVPPAILAIQAMRGEPLDVPVIVGASVVLFVLVLARAAKLAFEGAELSDRVRHLAFHDDVTGLPNRNLLRDRIDLALAASPRSGQQVGVLVIDLDDFKTVNDTLGHAAGDRLLSGVARRLEGCIRGGDTLARLGGDEFAIVMPTAGPAEARVLADRLLNALAAPFVLERREFHGYGSIGVALASPEHDVEMLLRDADLAMYAAKAAGKRRYTFFDPEMHTRLVEQLDADALLRQVMPPGETVLR